MRPHRTDVVSLVFGLVFLAIVLWWVLGLTVSVALPPLGWLVAAGLIVLGVLGLLGSLGTDRIRGRRRLDSERSD
jgi:hypothetical protein